MTINRKIVGKIEIAFTYMSRFFLRAWQERRSGFLFLTDGNGCVLEVTPLTTSQAGIPFLPTIAVGENLAEGGDTAVAQAICSNQAAVMAADSHLCWGAVPLLGDDGQLCATIGMVLPSGGNQCDIAAYLLGVESLLHLGYEAYLDQAAAEIVMNASQCDRERDMVRYVIEQVQEKIGKGYCSAAKLDENGFVMPGELVCTDQQPHDLLSEYLLQNNIKCTEQVNEKNGHLVLIPVFCEDKPLYAFFLHKSSEQSISSFDEQDAAFLANVGEKLKNVLLRAVISDDIVKKAKQKDLLYSLTRKMLASIDVNDVLTEIMESVDQLYPDFDLDIYLTVDTNTALPVKQLSFQDEACKLSSKAYMQGSLIVGSKPVSGKQTTIVAAPLMGKQGIYGVLQLTAEKRVEIDNNGTEQISILAETAGTAFENAQLYQQSRNLIRELRLINEMAKQLNRSLDVQEILRFVTSLMLDNFAAEYCAILEKSDDCFTVLSSSLPEQIGRTVSAEEALLSEIVRDKEPIILASPRPESGEFSLMPYASLMAVPLLHEAEVVGLLLVLDSRRNLFGFDDFKLLQIFGQHTSLAMTNALLHSEVERMAITDNLTGLYVRRYLDEQIAASLEQDSFGSLILVDIDLFKEVNDTYGHQRGDEVLIQVAGLIKQNIREADIAARWGGEEMAIYLPGVDLLTALNIANRIRSRVETETKPQVTVSSGVVQWDRTVRQEMTVSRLFHLADLALYEAKNKGRNQICLA
ncbi:diguanylate cyclase [Brevibacillus sp. B_LB10_24]|uniref:GGDEF domain-containing protein n=1 Tax=Brevibacillus sp. B_LB10_24 TaxID=3380645 RepID=UPI0038BE06FB